MPPKNTENSQMGMTTIRLSALKFQYPQATHPLFEGIDLTFGCGWTAILGRNGAGKSTLLQLATGILIPEIGEVSCPEATCYVEQRTDDLPYLFDEFATAYDHDACRLHGILRIDRDWLYRWETLSHGERKRAQLACALWQEPQAVAVDEPTNHLDYEAIEMIGEALFSYRGIGLLVTHDRSLADRLCTKSVIVHAPYVRMMDCSPSVALEQSSKISTSTFHRLQQQKKGLAGISSELNRRSQYASRQDAMASKRTIDNKDHDAKAKINGVRVSGADGHAGRLKKQLVRRVSRTSSLVIDIQEKMIEATKLDLLRPISGITISNAPLKRDFIARIPAGSLSLGPEKSLTYDVLEIGSTDRIGITGANGSGKSTFMQYLYSLITNDGISVTYVPQEQDRQSCESALKSLGVLDSLTKGRVISSLARLGSDPALIRSSAMASPGEAKKLWLSLLFEYPVSVLLLDEPTNHLDLQASLVLERALQDYQGALVCISHDQVFLDKICTKRLHISPLHGSFILQVVEI
ncbi:MAG: ATP-binding cassette domain-containing protein [Sphaerochaetaceae bacterium]|nr:ATP-binding cassette domain-containing protein [Sphaerochaetaceae bacterium]MDD4259051.1 ATP-binding cassette domain-containing protein [Sphaerochaetaceae bacterium]MDD5075878.1 ATP-binding cassette domain-containing protein [Sphaerochaetaceae bacterium]NLO59685.1 ABC-F family ATP-binding cassette domain-containing protein [Spirochaetales bacterium]